MVAGVSEGTNKRMTEGKEESWKKRRKHVRFDGYRKRCMKVADVRMEKRRNKALREGEKEGRKEEWTEDKLEELQL